MKKNIYGSYLLCLVLIVLFFYCNYNSLFIEIHDNLDQHYGWYRLLSDNHAWFSSNETLLPYMDATKRGLFLPETQLVNLIFYLLNDTLLAHCVLFVVKFTLGFFSFIALSNLLTNNKKYLEPVIILLSVSFALVPGNENLYIAQASLPLFFYLYLKLLNSGYKYLFFIFIYPFLSELTRYGMFILILISIHFIYLFISKKKTCYRSFLAILVLSMGYLLFEYRLIYSMVLSSEPSIRSSMLMIANGNIFKEFVKSLLFGQYHFSNTTLVILPIFSYMIYIKIKNNIVFEKIEMAIIFLIIIFAFINAEYLSTDFKYIIWKLFSPLAGWNYSRFIWMNSFLWGILLLLIIDRLYSFLNKYIIYTLLSLQVVLQIIYPVYGNDFYKTFKCNLIKTCEYDLSYQEFFSQSLFDSIKQNINYTTADKVVAFGFHPSILTFNGIHTVDGYHNAYYQSYKDQFSELISPVLGSSVHYNQYFNNWGGRAYIFSDDVLYTPYRTPNNTPTNIPIDFDVVNKLGINYIISNRPLIINYNLIGKFSDQSSPYTLYVYKTN